MPNPNADVANAKLNKSLENLLVSKNRRLLEDLTKLRVSWDELSTSHTKSEEVIEELQNEVGRIKSLNERLENDLMSLNKEGELKDREGGPGLAGLDIGRPVSGDGMPESVRWDKCLTSRTVEDHLLLALMATRQSCPSSRRNVIVSGSVTPS